MGKLTLTHERIDDIPLLIKLGQTLQLDAAVDEHLATHGLQQGLSNGQLTVVWLAYILSESDHRKSGVEDWAQRHRQVLAQLLGQPVRRVDFSDDRLGNLLRRFSDTGRWEALEATMWRTSVQVYAWTTTQVRLDSTTTCGYHQVQEEGLMQYGHSKDHRPDLAQLKLMAALAEPARQWCATDLYTGQTADDGLYIPLYERTRAVLGQTGLVYIGDRKMAPVATRAHIQAGGDYYLTRGAQNLFSAAQWATWAAQRDAQDSLVLFWEAGEIIGGGCEWEHEVPTPGDAGAGTWTERLQWVYSSALAARQQRDLEQRLHQAETALRALTPAPGRGKRAIRELETLETRITAILTQYRVTGLLQPQWERVEQRTTRYVGRGRGSAQRATREVVREHYRITDVIRVTATLTAQQHQLGWEIQFTNAPISRLSLPEATRTYREGWHLEHSFHRFKAAPIGVRPLFVWRDDQLVGLTRLLTLALRLLTLIETQVAQELVAAEQALPGLYEGQPSRVTQQPTAARLLKALCRAEITLTHIHDGEYIHDYLTPGPSWLPQILAYLKLPLNLYDSLIDNHP